MEWVAPPRPLQAVAHRHRGLDVQDQGPAGDVAAVVADPLQLRDDLEGGGDQAQVRSERRPQGQQVDAGLVQLQLRRVHLPVQVRHPLGLGVGPLVQGLFREGEHLLHLPGHGQQGELEFTQVVVEMPHDGCSHLCIE